MRLIPVLFMALMIVVSPTTTARVGAEDPGDISGAGPYSVGVTQRTFVRPSSTGNGERVMDTVIWYPARPAPGTAEWHRGTLDAPAAAGQPFPALLFSHGTFDEPWSSSFLTAHLASHGFVVIAPSHPGNTAHDCPPPCDPTTFAARAALLDSGLNRPADVISALDQTLASVADPILGGLVDPSRLGALGHSFGGWTSMLVGARDARFRAIAPIAAPVLPGTLEIAETVGAPTLLLAGEKDTLTRLDQERQLSLALTRGGGPHWLVVINGAGHLAFSDVCGQAFGGCGPNDLPHAEAQALTNAWTTAFFKRYVALDERESPWLDRTDPGTAVVEVSTSNLP